MLTTQQKKSALNSAKTRLTNLLQNWEQQQVSPVLNAQQQVLLSPERIKSILIRVFNDVDAMYYYLMRGGSEHDDASPITKQIEDCLNGNGYKKIKLKQNFIDTALNPQVEIERSIAYKFTDNEIIVNVFTNTKLANGDPNSHGFLGDGSDKIVKEAIRITIKENTLTTSFIAKGTILLDHLKENGQLSEIQRYSKNLSEVQREVNISRRYNSRYINEMELGPIFDSAVYINKESSRKVSKKKIQTLISQDVNETAEANTVLPDNIISTRYKSIHVFSEKALGCMTELSKLLTPEEKTLVENDLRNFRMPAIFYNLFNDALEALKVMHQRGDVHGDFKLDNLLISDDFTVKLADFGATTLQEDNMTVRAANILGTHYFASPEITKYRSKYKNAPKKTQSLADLVCANHKIADIVQNDPKHDMWSFGISLFCMLVNKDKEFTANNCDMKQSLDFISRKHPILKELLAIDMHKRPSAERAQQLLRLDYLLTNNPLEYKDGDLELLEQHHLSLITKGTYCGVFFKPRTQDPTPHNSIRLVIDKIEAVRSRKALLPLSIHKTTSSASLQTN